MIKPLFPLQPDQLNAAAPDANVWLSASAGTGKTQVLSARVFRLLLTPGVRPENILCLTFTKAGAAEMANRINGVLARWVQVDDAKLGGDLLAIGAANDPATLAHARTLFAAVLDAPGAGLRVQTIHSFCQSLLSGFPAEADILPGFKAIEERDQNLLIRRVLGDLVLEAKRGGDTGLLDAIAGLSLRLGEEGCEKFLVRCAASIELWETKDLGWHGDLLPHVNTLFGLPDDANEAMLHGLASDTSINAAALRHLAGANRNWGAKTGLDRADVILQWLSGGSEERLAGVNDILRAFLTAKGEPYVLTSGITRIEPDYARIAHPLIEQLIALRDIQALLAFAAEYSRSLAAGRAFACAYRDAKRREGVMDFDDLIRVTAQLLNTAGMAEWIRYKLDQQFDHVLVDEAQDTNARQWQIARSLVSDYFAGAGVKPGATRTLFTVGDYKQAIYSFQGTSPEEYTRARAGFTALAAGGRNPLKSLSLSYNFRSSDQILALVDQSIDHLGYERLGLSEPPPAHRGDARPGQVTLWQHVEIAAEAEDDEDGDSDPWLSKASRMLADKLAIQIRDWIDNGLWLDQKQRFATPGDIMILVRTRSDLASLIVARLHAKRVPVAGVDRLRLGQPLGIQDVLAAMKFALQPLDDLNLASLLVSPLCGWTQEQLLDHTVRPKGDHLWPHIRETLRDSALLTVPHALLAMADYGTPYQFLEQLLSGPLQGRAKLRARLGGDVLDPVNEFVSLALAFERDHVPSLQGFVHWFEASDTEIKREISEAASDVRVMTVHGAKGLQSPVVIIADAAGTINATRSDFKWKLDNGHDIPMHSLKSEERVGNIKAQFDAVQATEAQEYWRLLYVAMTRAEEHLFIAGALGKRQKEIPPDSWYGQLEPVFDDAECGWQPDTLWGNARTFGNWHPGLARPVAETTDQRPADATLPDWLDRPVVEEARPARPLAPSRLGADDAVDSPALTGDAAAAARRGALLHRLFERLPELPLSQRADAANSWLAQQAGVTDAAERLDIITHVIAVLDNPDWAQLFGPDALAEAPIAARVGDQVISGTVDRLLITDSHVTLIDFKTSRRPPTRLDAIAPAYLRQMAAYSAAVARIFPNRAIITALLFTQTPQIFVLPPGLLSANMPE